MSFSNCRDVLLAAREHETHHPGLALARYIKDIEDSAERLSMFLDIITASHGSVFNDLYGAVFERWDAQIRNFPSTISANFRTLGNIIIELGEKTVLGTGLRLHYTYGVPVLPGSSLKGLAAHYTNDILGEFDDGFKRGGPHYKVLFGDTSNAGHICFHDALIAPQSLGGAPRLDIVTPHHKNYFSGGSTPPSDYDSSVPIQFLSIHGTFRIHITCDTKQPQAKEWVELALKILEESLLNWGIGGKTSSGYGLLKRTLEDKSKFDEPTILEKTVPKTKNTIQETRRALNAEPVRDFSSRTTPSDERFEGIVKWFNSEKGFGFIMSEFFKDDIFVHISNVREGTEGLTTLEIGDNVRFYLGPGRKGFEAKDVKKMN